MRNGRRLPAELPQAGHVGGQEHREGGEAESDEEGVEIVQRLFLGVCLGPVARLAPSVWHELPRHDGHHAHHEAHLGGEGVGQRGGDTHQEDHDEGQGDDGVPRRLATKEPRETSCTCCWKAKIT